MTVNSAPRLLVGSFPYHTKADCLPIKEHTTYINIYIQTCFIMDVPSDDSILPHLVPFWQVTLLHL